MYKNKKVLIGSPVHQKPCILREFLKSLRILCSGSLDFDYMFIDDNSQEESTRLLKDFQETKGNTIIRNGRKNDEYICDEKMHYWKEDLIWKVAGYKNAIIRAALDGGYDFLFLVDSDIILQPETVIHLAGTGADVVSEVFWTKWQPDLLPLPNVWLFDQYDMVPRKREEKLTKKEAEQRRQSFLRKLKSPGTYEVGMLGACTLITRQALHKGLDFTPVKNLTLWGEDRHFCVRAAVYGIRLFVDTYFPARHIYRECDLET